MSNRDGQLVVVNDANALGASLLYHLLWDAIICARQSTQCLTGSPDAVAALEQFFATVDTELTGLTQRAKKTFTQHLTVDADQFPHLFGDRNISHPKTKT